MKTDQEILAHAGSNLKEVLALLRARTGDQASAVAQLHAMSASKWGDLDAGCGFRIYPALILAATPRKKELATLVEIMVMDAMIRAGYSDAQIVLATAFSSVADPQTMTLAQAALGVLLAEIQGKIETQFAESARQN